MRILNLIIGLLLLPVCAALTMTTVSMVEDALPASLQSAPPAVLAFFGGVVLWLIVFFTLPTPARSYVFAHELTHAIWGMATGARISRMKVRKNGGSVTLSKANLMVTLAPYFFPLYTVVAISLFLGLSAFLDMRAYHLWWLGVIGVTWGFHVTFTVATLMQKQTDIHEYGYVLSYALIYLMNLVGICIWLIAVTPLTIKQTVLVTAGHLAEIDLSIYDFLRKGYLTAAGLFSRVMQ